MAHQARLAKMPEVRNLATTAFAYYGVLRYLETGQWDATAVKAVEDKMTLCGAYVETLTEKQKALWYDFHQTGLNTSDVVNRSVHDTDARINYWRNVMGDLSNKLQHVDSITNWKYWIFD